MYNKLDESKPFLIFLIFCCFLFTETNCVENTQQIPHAQLEGLSKAEELFNATLYAEVIPLYQDLLKDYGSLQVEMAARARLRLAQSFFFTEKYLDAVSILTANRTEERNENTKEYTAQGQYMLALAYRNMGLYEQAITALKNYLKMIEATSNSQYQEAHFELGLAYFLWGQLTQARNYFDTAASISPNLQLAYLARLYVARIDIAENHFLQAELILSSLARDLPKDHVLRFELGYLRGEVYFQLHDYTKAAEFFEKALPQRNYQLAEWYPETLYHLGWSYLKIGDDPQKSPAAQQHYFEKSEASFNKLLECSPDERVFLALGQCYLTKASRLKEEKAYHEAEKLLAKNEVFVSHEAKTHALLLRAEAAPSYSTRDMFYRQLTQDGNSDSPYYAKGWYLRGLNDYEEGLSLSSLNRNDESAKVFERAAISLKKAYELLKNSEKSRAALALKYQALAYYNQKSKEGYLAGYTILDSLIKQQSDIHLALQDPDEIFYFHSLLASLIAQMENQNLEKKAAMEEAARQSLQQAIINFPKGKFAPHSLNLLGLLQYANGTFLESKQTFIKLVEEYPESSLASEALFWCSFCSERLQESPANIRAYRQQVYERYPLSPYAAEAYFSYYSYRDYLQGDRAAIKHLQAFKEKFPESPYLINAYYLIGLDYKRDRKTPEGKWVRRKNLTSAIDAFQEVENMFDSLTQKNLIAANDLEYFVSVRYRSTLERALANLAIADESQGAKKKIYLEYAEEVFYHIMQDFENSQNTLAKLLINKEPYPAIQEESAYWLAQTYIRAKDDEEAEKVLSQMIEKYQSAKITRGYFLSRVWYEQGMIAMRRQENNLAIKYFAHAEDAAKGKILSADQKLDLWIQQSLCYQALKQLDKAMLILSKVINDDAVSGMRLKAMYLRAEIYELQGRQELARKQLEATAKKGGEWALKAKSKLEQNYGYQ